MWPKKTRVWAYSQEEHAKHVQDGLIWWGVDGSATIPQLKRYRHLLKRGDGCVPSTLWDCEFCGHTDDAKKEFRAIFEDKSDEDFVTIKPTSLLRRIFQIATNKDSVVLDSFAGSGTTAHAVLALNNEDGGARCFVLVECEDYADTLTAERVRRVIKGVPSAKDEALKAGLGGTFSFFKLGKPMRQESLLDGTNLPDYEALAAYVFFTATGEEWDPKRMKRKECYIGESRLYDVFLFYEPEIERLKDMALTLDVARKLPSMSGKNKLVFAPTKYLDQEFLDRYRITFCQIPFQIYKAVDGLAAPNSTTKSTKNTKAESETNSS